MSVETELQGIHANLNKMVLDGKVKMTSENHDADLYDYTMEFLLNNGFRQYEVSNFSKEYVFIFRINKSTNHQT